MIEPAELAGIIRDQVSREVALRMDGLRAAFDLSIRTIEPGKDGRDGLHGKDGAGGAKGDQGAQGEKGDPGEKGDQGEPGKPGDRGLPGEKGDEGPAGKAGEKGAPGLDGKDGFDGRHGDPGQKGDPGERGKDGRDGVDGKSVELSEVLGLVTMALEQIPKPRDGVDGKAGATGEKGEPGHAGKDGAPGRDGEKGADGVPGKDGAPGQDGQKGDPGHDGKSVTLDEIRPIFEGEVAKWALDFERRAGEQLQKAIERMPAPKDGTNGKDGLGFDDAVVEKSGDRTIAVLLKNGSREKRFELAFPVVLDRGVFKSGASYEAGDGVTFAGSWWLAQRDTKAAPGDSSGDWRLAVKRGKDGRDA